VIATHLLDTNGGPFYVRTMDVGRTVDEGNGKGRWMIVMEYLPDDTAVSSSSSSRRRRRRYNILLLPSPPPPFSLLVWWIGY